MKTWPENRPTGVPAGTVQPLWTTTLGGRGPSGVTRSKAATEPSKREGRARRTASLTGPGGPRIALTSREKENGYVRDEEDICRSKEEGRMRSEAERLPRTVQQLGAAEVHVAACRQILCVS